MIDSHEELLKFMDECEAKEKATLGEYIMKSIFQDLIAGNCKITGYAKQQNKVWMELTWDWEGKHNKEREDDGKGKNESRKGNNGNS